MQNLFILKATQDTAIKLDPQQASLLPADQKYSLKAGETYPVANFAKHDDLHFRVAFGVDEAGKQVAFPGPNGQGRTTWLIFQGHCVLLRASDGKPAVQFISAIPLKLQNLVNQDDLTFSFDTVGTNPVLTAQIQEQLVLCGLLDAPVDVDFGPVTAQALQRFQELANCAEKGYLGPETAQKLLAVTPLAFKNKQFKFDNSLASRIVQYMLAKGYEVASAPKEYNIVYVEGMEPDGQLNSNTPNAFNDLRVVIEVVNGVPTLVDSWEATTEPGKYYTVNPMNPKGASRIQFGQYKAWRVGTHGKADPHEALVQVDNIKVYRDFDRNYNRLGDMVFEGVFGVNQHWGFDFPKSDIRNASAGCLVGRTRQGHREFMALIKQDRRYQANRNYIFYTTVISGQELVTQFPA